MSVSTWSNAKSRDWLRLRQNGASAAYKAASEDSAPGEYHALHRCLNPPPRWLYASPDAYDCGLTTKDVPRYLRLVTPTYILLCADDPPPIRSARRAEPLPDSRGIEGSERDLDRARYILWPMAARRPSARGLSAKRSMVRYGAPGDSA